MRQFSKAATVLTGLALGAAVACGGDSTSPAADNSLTPAEARVVASSLFGEITAAVGSPTPSSSTVPAGASRATVPTLTATINANCREGGTIQGTYLFTSDLDAAGTGTKSGSITVTASQCKVSTGERTISTDGSYTYTFSAGFTNNVWSSDFVWKANGAFTWTGGSCTLDYTVTITPQGARSYSGTVCGTDVSANATS
jgi:hypothetical protein